MTRVNVIPVQELVGKHLVAEYREIVRIFGVRREAQKARRRLVVPPEYVLGTGHVTFFTDKLQFVLERYQQLVDEMVRRGYNPNPIPEQELTNGIDKRWFGSYTPTIKAQSLNRQRIAERLGG